MNPINLDILIDRDMYGRLYGHTYGQLYGSRKGSNEFLQRFVGQEVNDYGDRRKDVIYYSDLVADEIETLVESESDDVFDDFFESFQSAFEEQFNSAVFKATILDPSHFRDIQTDEDKDEFMRGYEHGIRVAPNAAKIYFNRIRRDVSRKYYDQNIRPTYDDILEYISDEFIMTSSVYNSLTQIEDESYPYILGVSYGFAPEFGFILHVSIINTILESQLRRMKDGLKYIGEEQDDIQMPWFARD